MASTTNIHFFVVEDDPMFVNLMKGLLKNLERDFQSHGADLNVHIQTFTDLTTAYTALEENKPDVILLDYYLVDEDNKAVTSDAFLENVIRIDPSIKIIVISGESEKDIVHKLKETGATFYISKHPKNLQRLVPILRMMIDKHLNPSS